MNVCFHFRHTGKGTEDIIVDDNITKAVAASMVTELKLYAQQSHAYEKRERLKFGSLSPEVVALYALQADKIARTSRTQEIDAALWKDNPPEGWDILEEAKLTPLSIFPAFIAICEELKRMLEHFCSTQFVNFHGCECSLLSSWTNPIMRGIVELWYKGALSNY